MRDIKFKLWLGGICKMTAGFPLNELADIIRTSWTDKIIPLQFTGLIDRNGVDIYEGDRVRLHTIETTIVFKNGCFGYFIDTDGEFQDFIPLGGNQWYDWDANCKSTKVEVIGNKYETKPNGKSE